MKKIKLNKFLFPIVLFLISAIILSTLEYIGGILIEEYFGIVFWDYSNQPFNIGKYTSIKMGVIWGLSSILVIYIVKPLLDKFIKKIPKFITYILVFLFIIDIIYTIIEFGNLI